MSTWTNTSVIKTYSLGENSFDISLHWFVTSTAASHQVATETLWLHFQVAVMSSILLLYY